MVGGRAMKREQCIVENGLSLDSLELVVGIPSFNEADGIQFVVEQATAGLSRYFPHLKTAVVNADNCSQDGTREAFLESHSNEVPNEVPKVYLSTPRGVRGKGNNFHNLFEFLAPFQPAAVVVVDADLKSIRPEWIRDLAGPILKGFDFVAPLYTRNEYDGTITNHICYPILYGLLGREIRQPIGGDFSFSGRLMEHWRKRNWDPNVRHYGVDIFMTLEAVLSDFSIAQTTLGEKIHKPSAPKLGPMFTQVVDTLFHKLVEHRHSWRMNGANVVSPPILNRTKRREGNPQSLSVDYKSLKQTAMASFDANRPLICSILAPQTGRRLEQMFEGMRLKVSAGLWAEIIYSFLKAYGKSNGERRLQIIEALKPLYFARVVSFIRETLELDHRQSENRIVKQAETFRRQRRLMTGTG